MENRFRTIPLYGRNPFRQTATMIVRDNQEAVTVPGIVQQPRPVEYRHWSGAAAERWGFIEGDRVYPYVLRTNAERDAEKRREELEALSWVPLTETRPCDEPQLPLPLGPPLMTVDLDKLRKLAGYAIVVFLLLMGELAISGAIRGCRGRPRPIPVTGVCRPSLDPCQSGAVYSCTDVLGPHVYYCTRALPPRAKI